MHNVFITETNIDKILVYQCHFMPAIIYVTLCYIFQDMYDLILDYGCHCASHCEKPLTNVVNKLGFTPLTLAVKLARREVNSLLVRMI